MVTHEERVQRYAEAMAVADGGPDLGCFPADYVSHARAAMVVANSERAELRRPLLRVAALAQSWADQPTDYDEDTEQQIADGRAVLAALDGDS